MRVSRIYVPVPLGLGQQIDLDDESAHYVRTVLRLKKGYELIVFNGQGLDYSGHLAEVSRNRVAFDIEHAQNRDSESPLQIVLGLGISRGDRMDFAVQKAVELGVNHITPLFTGRCVVQLKADKKTQRTTHWQKIVQHACEQCGRAVLPALTDMQELSAWVDKQQGLKVFLDPFAQTSLADLKPEQMLVTLLTGPEGGFTDQERVIAKAAGFIPVRLGKRILRTETASLTALAAVQMLWGDFGNSQL